MKKLLFTLLVLSVGLPATQAQTKKYALKVLDILTSEQYHGRGYVNDGDRKAADYIAGEFERMGVKKFGDSYLQHFNLNVNTFPSDMDMEADGTALKPGVDFVVEPHSGSENGTFTPVWVDQDNFSASTLKAIKSKGNILVLDARGIEDKELIGKFRTTMYKQSSRMPVIWMTDKKFTWAVGRQASSHAMLEVQGGKVTRKTESITLNIKHQYIPNYQSQNVVGYIEGKHKKKRKQYIVIGGHYDHLGRMGTDTYFPGANDNASGIAYILSLVQHYSENPPDYSIVFMAFGAEEAGLVGSEYFAANPLFPLKKIRFMLNLDIMGTGNEGITLVNSTEFTEEYELMLTINNEKDLLAKLKKRGPTQNSDHYPFYKNGVRCFFIYTLGGNPAYHDVVDISENLEFVEFEDLHALFIEFIDRL